MLNTRYTDAWHHAEDTAERAWLDAWMRGHINPATLSPHEEPASAGTPVLAGSHR